MTNVRSFKHPSRPRGSSFWPRLGGSPPGAAPPNTGAPSTGSINENLRSASAGVAGSHAHFAFSAAAFSSLVSFFWAAGLALRRARTMRAVHVLTIFSVVSLPRRDARQAARRKGRNAFAAPMAAAGYEGVVRPSERALPFGLGWRLARGGGRGALGGRARRGRRVRIGVGLGGRLVGGGVRLDGERARLGLRLRVIRQVHLYALAPQVHTKPEQQSRAQRCTNGYCNDTWGLWPPFKACTLCGVKRAWLRGHPTVSPVLIPWPGLVVLRRLACDDLTGVDVCALAPDACTHPPPLRQSSVCVLFHVDGASLTLSSVEMACRVPWRRPPRRVCCQRRPPSEWWHWRPPAWAWRRACRRSCVCPERFQQPADP